MSAVLERRGTKGGPKVPVTARTRAVPAPPRLSRQLIRFAAIGAASTGAYLVLYLLLRPLGAQQANAIALLVTAIANTAANRRLTFAVRGPERRIRNQLQGLVVFAAGLAVTSGALALMHGLLADPGRLWEVAALVVANGMATLLRFVLLRTWVFDGQAGPA
ncbi:MAG: GtrA family protein [Kineosporiaceae bacterium]